MKIKEWGGREPRGRGGKAFLRWPTSGRGPGRAKKSGGEAALGGQGAAWDGAQGPEGPLSAQGRSSLVCVWHIPAGASAWRGLCTCPVCFLGSDSAAAAGRAGEVAGDAGPVF